MVATTGTNSRRMIARRTAGKLGDDGGPGTRGGIFPRPRRGKLGEAEVLEISEGDAGHQGVSMQPRPGAPLEMAEAEFLLELLMGLLADPACLDRSRQGAPRGSRRQIAEVVFALAVGAPFADQPDFLAREVAVV